MRKRPGLVAAVVLLFAVVGAVAGLALYRVGRRNVTGGLAGVPRDAAVVASVDVARLRAYSPLWRLRRALLTTPSVARAYDPLRAGCGFHPLDRLDSVTVAWDRAGLRESNRWVALVTGRADRREATRCLAAFAARGDAQVAPLAPVDAFPVIALAPRDAPWASAGPRVAVLGNGALVASQEMLRPALAAVDGRAPTAERNARLRGAIASLGGTPIAFLAVDARAVAEAAPQDWMSALLWLGGGAESARTNPSASAPALAFLGAESVAVGLLAAPTRLRVALVARFATPGEAQSAHVAATRLLGEGRHGATTELLRAEESYLRRVAEVQAFEPGVSAQVVPLQQMFALVNSLYDRVRLRVEGAALRAEVDVTPAEVTTLEVGARAALASEAAAERTRAQREAARQALPPSGVP